MMTYSELIKLETFEDRLAYLSLDALPSEVTFANMRWLNQKFYTSKAWRRVRDLVITRDHGWDLAVPGRPIFGKVLVHHINPLRPKDLYLRHECILDPENLITVSNQTHLAIHFGSETKEPVITERFKGDTKLW